MMKTILRFLDKTMVKIRTQLIVFPEPSVGNDLREETSEKKLTAHRL